MTRQPSYNEAYWNTRIAATSVEQASREYAAALPPLFDSKSIDRRHWMQHEFGGALYVATFASKGFALLDLCGDSASNGCYHEFVGRSVIEHGDDVLSRIQAVCDARTSQPEKRECFHAIGHGLLASRGSTENDLKESVNACARLFAASDVASCYTGVFMEYNERNMTYGYPVYRELGEDIFDPCDSFEVPLQQGTCMLRQVKLWRESMLHNGVSTEEVVRTMSHRCAQLEAESSIRMKCFFAFGVAIVYPANFDMSRISTYCTLAPAQESDASTCMFAAEQYLGMLRQ